ncbi:Uncharacterised protein [Vibrio cholerae]|nr:Uncharacterised protein [Vibrio cholerae]
MRNTKSLPPLTKHISTHFTNRGVIFHNVSRRHNQIPAKDFGIELHRCF